MMGEVERELEMVHVSSEREGGRVRLKDASEDAGCSGGSWVGNSQLVEGRRGRWGGRGG
jgi:hypothetical protein